MSETSESVDRLLESLVGQVADEFLRRQREGECPDVEEYVARYPEAADLLRPALESLRLLDCSRAGCDAPAEDVPGEVRGTLGDFRIVREVGRGGMGVVYEAEQISLGRRVALKVLPLAGMMDERHLRRFKNEALAAAHLDHPNIVDVLGVGSERGVHYYAMRFIEGQTLADIIRDLRGERDRPTSADDQDVTRAYTPPATEAPAPAAPTRDQGLLSTKGSTRDAGFFRAVAQLGAQVAEALEHAHQQGIVHRDVKPSNLLLDGRGKPWVTDFGLAQIQSDVKLTQTGDLVGTLRYMSPEQALAKRVPIDHRTDVYSLGATLYELLTLRPVFEGSDRQELLRQIAFDEPTRPRRLNRGVPQELETIVLKALEKNPNDRYPTAQELADDLTRYLKDEPIRARTPSVSRRLQKWALRHLALVWATALGLALALVGLSVSTVIALAAYRAESKQRTQAEQQEQLAQVARKQAEDERDLADRRLVATRMHLAHKSLEENELQQAEGLLNLCVPQPGRPDFRGWEWSYLKARCHRELVSIGGREERHLIQTVAWSADGRRLLTTGRKPDTPGRSAAIWDAFSGVPTWTLDRLADDRPAWSPDGRHLAAEGKIWDSTIGKVVASLATAGETPGWSPDGQRLAFVGRQSVRVWDVATHKELLSLAAGGGQLAWSPRGRYLAVGIKEAKVWDVTTGKQVLAVPLSLGPSSFPAVAWSPQETHLAVVDPSGTVQVYDLATGQSGPGLRCYSPTAHALCWSPNGQFLAVSDSHLGSRDPLDPALIRIWDWRTGEEHAPLQGHRQQVRVLAWQPAGRLLASWSRDGSAKVWDTVAGKEIRSFPHGFVGIVHGSWSPDGQRLAALSRSRVLIWDVTMPAESLLLQGDTVEVCSLAWRPDSQRLAAAAINGRIRIWDPVAGKDLATLPDNAQNLNWSPDGQWLAYTLVGSGRFVVRDAATGKEERSLNVPRVAFSWEPHGKRLAVVGPSQEQTRVTIFDWLDGREVLSWSWDVDVRRGGVQIAWSPDGTRVAAISGRDGLLTTWDAATGEERLCVRDGLGQLILFGMPSIAWSPDGRWLAVADHRGNVRVLEAATGEEFAVLREGHSQAPVSLAWSPDNRRLLSWDVGGTLRFWDVVAGQETLVLRIADGKCRAVAWSPDGRHLATAHLSGTVRIWDTTPRR